MRTLARNAGWLVMTLGASFLLGCSEGPSEVEPEREEGPVTRCDDGPNPAHGPLDGQWLGWTEATTFMFTICSEANGSLTGDARMVGTFRRFDLSGSSDTDGVVIVLDDLNNGQTLVYRAELGDDLQGEIDGIIHRALEYEDSPLTMSRLPADHSPLGGRAWSRVSSISFVADLLVVDGAWLVAAYSEGVRISTDEGETWETVLRGLTLDLAVHPEDPKRVVAAAGRTIYASEDGGRTWQPRFTEPQPSGPRVEVTADGSIWILMSWPEGEVAGVYRSDGWDGEFEFLPFPPWEGVNLILWRIAESPWTGTLFASIEIDLQPGFYNPPFYRSEDGGQTWTDVSGRWWHSSDVSFDRDDRRVYNLLEGTGLQVSTDDGLTWDRWSTVTATSIWVDGDRDEVWLGQVKSGALDGGVFLSRDGGRIFEPAGLAGSTIAGFARDQDGRLLAVAHESGIFRLDEHPATPATGLSDVAEPDSPQ